MADEKTVAETAAAAEAPRRAGAGRVVTTLVVVALLVACGYLGYLVWQGRHLDELRRSATEDASRLVLSLIHISEPTRPY